MASIPQAALPPVALAAAGGPAPRRFHRFLVGSLIVLGLAALLASFFSGGLARPLRPVLQSADMGAVATTLGLFGIGLGLVTLAGRTLLWFFYRPHQPAAIERAPTLTVVIPAYNEGPMVELSIESVAAARYPRDRLEILVVDDGSTDDTWTHIQRAADRHPGLVTAVKLDRNQGKRAALATGFRAARGTILVTIDSDSVIEPGALLAMAGPFRDPRVGAVAGKVSVLNRDGGLIARMLHVRFVLSFDFQRSVQSMYRTVYCCPGALAGYRASVVREVLEPWLGQRFLGAPCTFGEDRALTSAILERRYDTVYQGNAVVHTIVPETYDRLCRMFLRWDRSHVREELRFLRIMWKRPAVPLAAAAAEKLVAALGLPVGGLLLGMLAVAAVADPTLLPRLLIVIGAGAAFSMLYYLYQERSMRFVHGILYSYFALFTLWWVFPYAVATVRSRSWGTR